MEKPQATFYYKTMEVYYGEISYDMGIKPFSYSHWHEGKRFCIPAVKQDFEKGILKDWGSFIGEGAGFCILEGTELECMNIVQQYIPYVAFTTHAIASFDQTEEMIKSMIT